MQQIMVLILLHFMKLLEIYFNKRRFIDNKLHNILMWGNDSKNRILEKCSKFIEYLLSPFFFKNNKILRQN